MCRFYSLTLKNTGDIFEFLDYFDHSKKYYSKVKVFMHGNLKEFCDIHYSNQGDIDIFSEYRNFVTDCLFGVQSENGIDH